ncbi:hypothetical protein BDV93DRAFT_558208 [Ceratobasidium sp. AG-I]|nr:hypothetical protein BDV93DRAFT_558208 [Ceratobasidium sp. AG-I]
MADVYEEKIKHFFDGLHETLDLQTDKDEKLKELKAQRFYQGRPFSRNPFSDPKEHAELVAPGHSRRASQATDIRDAIDSGTNPERNKSEEPVGPEESKLEHPGPTWVNLFYDLAWTATFASLTQFHLGSIFFQLVIFGMLAATTRGFDVTDYILHTPGSSQLEQMETDQILDPELYAAERLASLSIKVIAISLAMSRVLLLIQHLRVLLYAYLTVNNKEKPMRAPWWKLSIIPLGLSISTPLFFAAWAVVRSPRGKTPYGAKLKFILWGAGILVEGVSHIRMSRLSWLKTNSGSTDNQNVVKTPSTEPDQPTLDYQAGVPEETLIVPYSGVKTRERLEAITTIILGEGINGIAGTLYSIISTPNPGGPTVTNIACAALIIYFLAYLYFEGSTGNRDLKESGRRQVYWVVMHFPLLLFIILLLQGIRNQFVVTSFLFSAKSSFGELSKLFEGVRLSNATVVQNIPIKNYFLKRGLTWGDEYQNLLNLLTQNGTISLGSAPLSTTQREELGAWNMRLSLKIMAQTYKAKVTDTHNFLGGDDEIASSVADWIEQYNTNLTEPDWTRTSGSPGDMHYYQILTAMINSKLQSTRYIMALAGLVLICMAMLDLIHSRPRDRFQWGSILSRFSTGWALVFLLLLNLGRYQSLWASPSQIGHQAGVYRWLSAYWVLPTIAIAYGIQFLIDVILVRITVIKYKRADPSTPQAVEIKIWLFVKNTVLGFFGRPRS